MNYLKKLEPHNDNDYVDKEIVIEQEGIYLRIKRRLHIYKGRIIPNRMILKRQLYDIIKIDPIFIISCFQVVTEGNLVKNVIITSLHPNVDTNTCNYCMLESKKNVPYDANYYHMLVTNIKTYYLDGCYFQPSKMQIEYKKVDSMFIQLNKGE